MRKRKGKSILLSAVLWSIKHLPIAVVQMLALSSETPSLGLHGCLMPVKGPFGPSLTASSQFLSLWFTHSLFLLGSYPWQEVGFQDDLQRLPSKQTSWPARNVKDSLPLLYALPPPPPLPTQGSSSRMAPFRRQEDIPHAHTHL